MDEMTAVRHAPRAVQAPDTDLLFQPYRLGPFNLPHRIVMAPLTRWRARQPGNVPSSLAACYYAQRASAALIVSEATQDSMEGQGYAWTPGIHSREQVEAWRRVERTRRRRACSVRAAARPEYRRDAFTLSASMSA